jgi:hypothetical protein
MQTSQNKDNGLEGSSTLKFDLLISTISLAKHKAY